MLFLLSLGFSFYLVLKKLSELYVKPTFTFTPSGLNNVTQHNTQQSLSRSIWTDIHGLQRMFHNGFGDS